MFIDHFAVPEWLFPDSILLGLRGFMLSTAAYKNPHSPRFCFAVYIAIVYIINHCCQYSILMSMFFYLHVLCTCTNGFCLLLSIASHHLRDSIVLSEYFFSNYSIFFHSELAFSLNFHVGNRRDLKWLRWMDYHWIMRISCLHSESSHFINLYFSPPHPPGGGKTDSESAESEHPWRFEGGWNLSSSSQPSG